MAGVVVVAVMTAIVASALVVIIEVVFTLVSPAEVIVAVNIFFRELFTGPEPNPGNQGQIMLM